MKQEPIKYHLATTTATAVPDKPAPASARHVFKLGLDVDLNYSVTAIQCGHGAIKPAQKLTRPQLLKWVREQVAAGHAVHTVYEACGFGYTLHEALVAAGAKSLVTTPMRLSPERRRKNDRLDARALCVRLARHLDGHAHELRPIRIPSAAERERRELGRQRNFWVREVRRLENHGRALRNCSGGL
jgi:transposase